MEKMFYSPVDFPCVSDSVSIQSAIDSAVATDIRTVVITPKTNGGDWLLDKTVNLPEGITIIIDGAKIRSFESAFKNSNSDNPESKSLGGEQSEIFIVGVRGAALISENGEPQIYLSNVKEYKISGITFVGGGLKLNFVRYGRVEKIRFENSDYGVLLTEGCNNNIIENIYANSKGYAVEFSGKDSYMFGRGLEIAETIVSRVESKSSTAVALSSGPCETYNIIIKDIVCHTDAPAVIIGDESDTFIPLDITVRRVKSKKTALKIKYSCDGFFSSDLFGEIEVVADMTRSFIDKKSDGDVALPEFDEWYAENYIIPDERFSSESDSETIQNALNFAIKEKKALIIPRYNSCKNSTLWELDKAIKVNSGAKIFFLNSHLRLQDYSYDNAFDIENASDITLVGVGNSVIDGGIHNGLTERNSQKFGMDIRKNASFYICESEKITIEGIHIKNSRWNSLYFSDVKDVKVKNITFTVHPLTPDLGGAVITGKSSGLLFENINGIVGDELIIVAENENKFYSVNEDDITENLTIRNISVNVSRRSVLRLICHDGRKIKDVVVDSVLDPSLPEEKKLPWSAVSIGSYNGAINRSCTTEELSNILIRDVYSRGDRIVELCQNSSNVTCENLHGFGSVAFVVQSTHFANSDNLYLNGAFFRCIQGSRYMRGTATSTITDKKKYIGSTASLVNFTTRNALFENVFVDKNGDAFRLMGGGKLEVNNFSINEVGRNLVIKDDKSEIIIKSSQS